jgi:hypothetical protein
VIIEQKKINELAASGSLMCERAAKMAVKIMASLAFCALSACYASDEPDASVDPDEAREEEVEIQSEEERQLERERLLEEERQFVSKLSESDHRQYLLRRSGVMNSIPIRNGAQRIVSNVTNVPPSQLGDVAPDYSCGILVIPSTVTSIEEESLLNCGYSAVTFEPPERLKSIGDRAFQDSWIPSICIPDSVETIGKDAFRYNNFLGSVQFGANSRLSSIGPGAFANCESLTSFNIPSSVQYIGNGAFSATSLNAVTASETSVRAQFNVDCLTNSMKAAWLNQIFEGTPGHGDVSESNYGCKVEFVNPTNEREVVQEWEYRPTDSAANSRELQGMLQRMAPYAVFSWQYRDGKCWKEALSYGYNGEENGKHVFVNYITYDEKGDPVVQQYSEQAPPEQMEKVIIRGSAEIPSNLAGSIFQAAWTTVKEITLEGPFTEIFPYAFFGCSNLETFNFNEEGGGDEEEGITRIGSYSFRSCSALRTISIPSSVRTIDTGAFCDCEALQKISLPQDSQLKYIENYAFRDCPNLTEVSSPTQLPLNSIGAYAFSGCSSLKSLAVSLNQPTINRGAFCNCENLEALTFSSFAQNSRASSFIGDEAFKNCSSLRAIDGAVLQKCTSIGKDAFSGCTALGGTIPINDKVTIIPEGAFRGCRGIEGVTFGDESRLETIGPEAFSGCASVTRINIPLLVNRIGPSAFAGCSNLRKIVISPEEVTGIEIGPSAFAACSSLKAIHLPAEVEKIGPNAFADCTSLETVVIDRYTMCNRDLRDHKMVHGQYKNMTPLQSIADGAFQNCSSLARVSLPSSVQRIGRFAFKGCAALTDIDREVEICYKPLCVEESAFEGCTALPSMIRRVPMQIGKFAFKGCPSIGKVEIDLYGTTIDYSAFADSGVTQIVFHYDDARELDTPQERKEERCNILKDVSKVFSGNASFFNPMCKVEIIKTIRDPRHDRRPDDRGGGSLDDPRYRGPCDPRRRPFGDEPRYREPGRRRGQPDDGPVCGLKWLSDDDPVCGSEGLFPRYSRKLGDRLSDDDSIYGRSGDLRGRPFPGYGRPGDRRRGPPDDEPRYEDLRGGPPDDRRPNERKLFTLRYWPAGLQWLNPKKTPPEFITQGKGGWWFEDDIGKELDRALEAQKAAMDEE